MAVPNDAGEAMTRCNGVGENTGLAPLLSIGLDIFFPRALSCCRFSLVLTFAMLAFI